MKPENHDLLAQAGSTKELMQVRYEDQVPGAIYAGANLRNPTKKRVASDSVFTRRPGGKELEDFVAAVLGLAAGEWKTAALLAHEAGVPFGIARRLKWTQLSGGCISWVCHEGTYEVQCSERLNQHLDSLTRDSEFIIPTLALMAEPWAQAEWRKSAHDLPTYVMLSSVCTVEVKQQRYQYVDTEWGFCLNLSRFGKIYCIFFNVNNFL